MVGEWELRTTNPVVECLRGHVRELIYPDIRVSLVRSILYLSRMRTYVPEPIPLCAALRVQRVDVVVHNVRHNRLDSMLEGLAVERRLLGDSERETVPC